MKKLSNSERAQVSGSIDKLLHYLMVYTRWDVSVRVERGDDQIYHNTFKAPKAINVSPTLFTRIDSCHGAGNCCRVPFDLVYTPYDRGRIIRYSHKEAVEKFGAESGERFEENRQDLLDSLEEAVIIFNYSKSLDHLGKLYIKYNHDYQQISGNKSCPYLFMGDDRYFCGVHPFKPLHCWYPHMTVRATEPKGDWDQPTVTIGRMQYGRNHNFGCPVKFIEHEDESGLFVDDGKRPDYFAQQFQDDIDKLAWTSKSAQSLGLTDEYNHVVGIDRRFAILESSMRSMAKVHNPQAIKIWRMDNA